VQKIKIRLPATLTSFGPGIDSLGLALSLYTHVEVSAREDERLVVETSGEGAGHYPIGLRHPVVLAATRVFQHLEKAPSGITIRIDNQIPLNSGLGAEAAFTVAGVIAGNNLMGNPFNRKELIEFAARVSPEPNSAITSMLGGLTATLVNDEQVIYRNLELQQFQVIVAIPDTSGYEPPDLPDQVTIEQAIFNIARMPLFVEAMRDGDMHLLSTAINDQIHAATIAKNIMGYAHVVEVARLAGTLGATTSGSGPAIVFLADKRLPEIAAVVERAFKNLEIQARVMVLSTDSQGIVISMMQSA